MAGEADIEDSRLNTVVLHDVYNTGYKGTSLPGEGAAWFENHT